MPNPAILTTSQSILALFADPKIRAKHNALELLDCYTPDMEVQLNVSADGGEPVKGKRNTWLDPDDSLSEEWHNVRIPRNANAEPERNDWPLKFNLVKHVEAIGITGWDFGKRRSRRVGFDFDAITGHAAGVGISASELEAVKEAAWQIAWIEIRKSTGGGGLHLWAIFSDEGIPTANHTEHAALGRAILEMLSTKTGFNFTAKVDACGGNMWIWHRKSSLDNEGLKLLKPATARLSAADIPGDWRSHLEVVQRKRATQRVIGVPASADDAFDQLVSARTRIPFDDEHRRIMQALPGNGFSMIYQQDNHLVQVHTTRLMQLIADPAMKIKGIFKTLSEGKDPGKPNAFMFPLRNGAWRVFRFSPGTREADTWEQGDGWTYCDFNVRATLTVAAEAEGGYEQEDGSFVFETAVRGIAALKGMGADITVPDWCSNRQLTIKPNKQPRKVTVAVEFADGDENDHAKSDMRQHHWNLSGKRINTKRWTQVVKLPSSDTADTANNMLDRCDNSIRSVKSIDGKDAGWRIRDDDGQWIERERTGAKDALVSMGCPKTEIDATIGKLQSRSWMLRNLPFQSEFPGGRVWNIGAQLAFNPSTDEDRNMSHPHWDSILEHLGPELDKAVQENEWCQQNGITSGARYLLYWTASLIQRPDQKLPYLFFYGEQETGKSSFKNAVGLLMSRGNIEARNALLTQYNGELDGAILAYIEEVDLTGKASDAYNRMKDWITADDITINAKYANPYKSLSYVHWIQVANERRHCPIFEGDSRIVVIPVSKKPPVDIPWPELREILKVEAPDFLRTVKELLLPERGVGRLWLPVLDTDAKREAIVESKDKGQSGLSFDAKALETRLRLLLLNSHTGVCTSLVSELLKLLGTGPWSQDPSVFGAQLKIALKRSHERGLKAESKRTGAGVEWTIEEHWDETNIDPLQEWAQMSLLADYAMSVLRPSGEPTVIPATKRSSAFDRAISPSNVA